MSVVSSVPTIDDMLAANAGYAALFSQGHLGARPARKAVVVTCMDARMDPLRFLGLSVGDAHVIRNAGGMVSEALRSIAISQQLLGTDAVLIIHHTECGAMAMGDDDIRQVLKENLGADASDVDFMTFEDLDESVRADLDAYKRSSIVRQDIPVRGFVYDVRSGRLREVA